MRISNELMYSTFMQYKSTGMANLQSNYIKQALKHNNMATERDVKITV
jgi:hypothetical protein